MKYVFKISFFVFYFMLSFLFAQNKPTSYLLTHGNIYFPFNNSGVLADVSIYNVSGIQYKSHNTVFSAGFILSGKNGEKIWTNGVARGSRFADYLPGSYLNKSKDSLAYLYILKAEDEQFGQSWQNWKNAVQLGANFYDGDMDGIYNPIDKNENGSWDENEDRPDLIGNETIWCVYKDSRPSNDRYLKNISPQGIEIQQTIFVSNAAEELANTIFVRYKIFNSGLVSDKFDSVYFSLYADPDIGKHDDDLTGCDTLLNAGFCFQDKPDIQFGKNTPAILFDIISGPTSYIPGITYDDLNNNLQFDTSDIPLDTAYTVNGTVLGITKIPGAKNLGLSSFLQLTYVETYAERDDEYVFRNYMKGTLPNGDIIDPCTWEYGTVINNNCENVDGHFMCSGEPFYLNGWINNFPFDQQILANTGPFELIKNKPVEIIVAYIFGEDSSAIQSLKLAKINSRKVQFLFDNNLFEEDMQPVTEPPEPKLNYDFVLYQNYPNPFNPTTNIRYTLKNSGLTSLKVYDVLGKEISVLVNKEQSEGIYNIEFDASTLPSGIYFYKLTQGVFTESKKMVILR